MPATASTRALSSEGTEDTRGDYFTAANEPSPTHLAQHMGPFAQRAGWQCGHQ